MDYTFEIPKEMGEKWISALRSGKFNKGEEFLCRNNNYCCLGVLCKINDKKTGENNWIPNNFSDVIPSILCGETFVTEKLAGMNDSGEYSFNEIAKWIEENASLT